MGTRTIHIILYGSPRSNCSSVSDVQFHISLGQGLRRAQGAMLPVDETQNVIPHLLSEEFHMNRVMEEILLSAIRKNSNHSSEI